jgi:hypothetical protein
LATQNVKIEYHVDKSPLVGANAELDEMIKNNDQLTKKAKSTTEELKKQGKEADGLSGTLKKTAGILAAVFAADKIIDFGKEVFRIRGEMQRFSAVLTNTLGSKSEAQKALQQISKFAAETPFSVSQLTASFVKLANQGFKPTANEMRKLGDLASSTGKEFDQLAEAIIDAQTGEFERLKEFGIRASKQGDQVKFTFKGVETQTKFTSEAIKDYVLSLGDLQGVSGSMAAISTTLEGRISNLGDSYETLLNSIGERGQGVFAGAIGALGDLINATNEWVAIPAAEAIQNEQIELNNLVGALGQANISEDARKKLIEDISVKFPSFLEGNLNEKTSLENINTALIDVNKQYEKRIKLAVQESFLADIQTKLFENKVNELKLIEKIEQEKMKIDDDGQIRGRTELDAAKQIEVAEKKKQELLIKRVEILKDLENQQKIVDKAFQDVNNGKTKEELEKEAADKLALEKKVADEETALEKKVADEKAKAQIKADKAIKDADKGIKDAESLAKEEPIEDLDLEAFKEGLESKSSIAIENLINEEEQKAEIIQGFNVSSEEAKVNAALADAERDKTDLDGKRAKAIAELEIAGQVAGSIAELAGRETAFGKAASIAQATINVAQGVTKAFAQGGIGGFVTGALVAAAGAKSISQIVSTPTPKFEKGGRIGGNLHLNGGTLIEAERDEFIMSRKATSKYGINFMDRINKLEINPDVVNGLSGGSTPIIVKSDNSDLINEYRNRPINNISISEEGITLRTKRNNSIVQKKVKRYTT